MKLEVVSLKIPPPPKTYVLTLTEDEARIMVAMQGRVCSNSKTPAGQFSYALFEALYDALGKRVDSLDSFGIISLTPVDR